MAKARCDNPSPEAVLTYVQRAYLTGREHERQKVKLIMKPEGTESCVDWVRAAAERDLYGTAKK